MKAEARLITVDDLENLDKLFEEGLQAIVICEFGLVRSAELAECMAGEGTKTAYLDRGLYEISHLGRKKKKEVIKAIRQIPEKYVTLSDNGHQMYGTLIHDLRAEFVPDRHRGPGEGCGD